MYRTSEYVLFRTTVYTVSRTTLYTVRRDEGDKSRSHLAHISPTSRPHFTYILRISHSHPRCTLLGMMEEFASMLLRQLDLRVEAIL